jgi:hypothetical protein
MEKPVRAAALLATIAMGVACTACTSDASSTAVALPTRSSAAVSSTPSSAGASSTPSSAADDVPPPPEVGQCRNTPTTNLGENDWVDQTPVVDCSKTHTLQTLVVIKPVEKLTLAQVKQLVGSCDSPAAGGFVGNPGRYFNRLLYPAVYWPSSAQRAAGQNWVRCDIGVQATTHCCHPVAQLAPRTASLRGVVGADPGRFQQCIGELPAPSRNQPLTSCKKPHRAEALPDGIQLQTAHYPSAAALGKKGQSECAHLVAQRDDRTRLVLTPAWQPKASFSPGTLLGVCWIHRNSGLLPPIK